MVSYYLVVQIYGERIKATELNDEDLLFFLFLWVKVKVQRQAFLLLQHCCVSILYRVLLGCACTVLQIFLRTIIL